MVKITAWLLISIICAILYRLGGASKTGKWYDFLCNTFTRDIGVSAFSIFLLAILYGWNWVYILIFGLSWGALSLSYKKKGIPGKWWNWSLMGLGYSLAFLPLAIFTGLWLGFILRSVICIIGITFWRTFIDNVVWEECGTGAIFTSTIPLLLI